MYIDNYYDACGCGFSGRVPAENIFVERYDETGEDLISWVCADCDTAHETPYALSDEYAH